MSNDKEPSSKIAKPQALSKVVYLKDATASFQKDVEDFLLKFEADGESTYMHFSQLWRECSFHHVFGGLTYVHFIKDITEGMFFTISKFVCFPRSKLTQVGALYLYYGLYFLQPIENFVKIRLTLEEYNILIGLITEFRTEGNFDPFVVFAKLKAADAFMYVAERQVLALTENYLKRYEAFYDNTFESVSKESSLHKFQEVIEDPLVDSLKETQSKYEKALQKFAKKHHDLHITPFELPSAITLAKQNILQIDDNVEVQPEETAENIKNRAFRTRSAVYRGSKECVTALDIKKDAG